jgi:hypothetical protein
VAFSVARDVPSFLAQLAYAYFFVLLNFIAIKVAMFYHLEQLFEIGSTNIPVRFMLVGAAAPDWNGLGTATNFVGFYAQ